LAGPDDAASTSLKELIFDAGQSIWAALRSGLTPMIVGRRMLNMCAKNGLGPAAGAASLVRLLNSFRARLILRLRLLTLRPFRENCRTLGERAQVQGAAIYASSVCRGADDKLIDLMSSNVETPAQAAIDRHRMWPLDRSMGRCRAAWAEDPLRAKPVSNVTSSPTIRWSKRD